LSKEKAEIIRTCLFPALAEGCEIFKSENEKNENEKNESSVERICREFGHTEVDASLWLSRCKYAVRDTNTPMAIDLNVTNKSVEILKIVGLIRNEFVVDNLWGQNVVIKFLN
jgi:hypothetical protein